MLLRASDALDASSATVLIVNASSAPRTRSAIDNARSMSGLASSSLPVSVSLAAAVRNARASCIDRSASVAARLVASRIVYAPLQLVPGARLTANVYVPAVSATRSTCSKPRLATSSWNIAISRSSGVRVSTTTSRLSWVTVTLTNSPASSVRRYRWSSPLPSWRSAEVCGPSGTTSWPRSAPRFRSAVATRTARRLRRRIR